MTHHTKKEREDNPFKTILGSQAIMGCCDSVFVMERSDQPNQFTLHATGKFTEDLALNLKREECLFKFDGSHYEAKLKKIQDNIWCTNMCAITLIAYRNKLQKTRVSKNKSSVATSRY
jgi:hypothetical protein